MPSEAEDGSHGEQNDGTDVTDNALLFDEKTTHRLHIITPVHIAHYASLSIFDSVV